MKHYVRSAALVINLFVVLALALALRLQSTLPDAITMTDGEELRFDYPIEIIYREAQTAAFSDGGQTCRADLKLPLGIQIKTVEITVTGRKTVVVSGAPFGVKMLTDGLMIVGMSDIPTSEGRKNPAKDSGLKIGDMLTAADGVKLMSNEHLGQIVADSGGKRLSMDIVRDGKKLTVTVTPALSKTDGCYHIGVWVRDSSAGIGTMTFYDPVSGVFAGLGHPICDVDTGELMPLDNGEIVAAEITGCRQGEKGTPGELRGRFIESDTMGVLVGNGAGGVWGMLVNKYRRPGMEMPVASASEVRTGEAVVYATVEGTEPGAYTIQIEKVFASDNGKNQNLVICVTDEELLELTGGIVQGMSGSPIVQDGMLVGAVTHVFVNDPTRGYGIFAETMLEQASGTAAAERAAA